MLSENSAIDCWHIDGRKRSLGGKVNKFLSGLVEDKVNGIQQNSTETYDDNDNNNSKLEVAIQFQERVHLGRLLKLDYLKILSISLLKIAHNYQTLSL